MTLILGAVLGVVYLVFFLLKRAGGRSMQSTDLIRVLGAQSLPGNRAVYLVSVGKQVFLVGGADQAVTLISEIDDKETVDEILLNAQSQEEARPRSFGDVVSGLFGNRASGSTGNGGRDIDEPLGFLRSQRERLKKL
jgi:flagellar protein FliO/FliZ